MVSVEDAHKQRGFKHVLPHEVDYYTQIMTECRTRLALPPAPAMPLIVSSLSSVGQSNQTQGPANGVPGCTPEPHPDRIGATGECSSKYFALVHTPVPLPKAMQLPEARSALNAEWRKLQDKETWVLSSVKEKHEVCRSWPRRRVEPCILHT